MASTSKLGDAVGSWLEGDRVVLFRKHYRSFRSGAARGAKGEPSGPSNPFLVDQGSTVPAAEESIAQDGAFYAVMGGKEAANMEVFNAITAYRLSYLRFRNGASSGATGEVTSVTAMMDKRHARFMPVGQRAYLLAHREQKERPKSKFHVHFGAGRLGLSLVVPAIARGDTPFCLVDAPFGDYEQLQKRKDGKVNFSVNGELALEGVTLITSAEQLPEAYQLYKPGTKLMVLSVDPVLVGLVIGAATTISTSLGPVLEKVVVAPLLKDTVPEGAEPAQLKSVYCCENDHGMVDKMAEILQGKANVVTCMVDRISTDREVDFSEEKVTHVQTSAEPHVGEIVVLNPTEGIALPPFTGDNVRLPFSEAEAHYFCRRKISIVNGMHTTLAFMTLCEKEEGDNPGNHPLLTHEKASDEQKETITHWVIARLLVLMWELDFEVMKNAHGLFAGGDSDSKASTESTTQMLNILLDYAKHTVARFDTIEDTTGRVLAGGVANRWQTRLQVVQKYTETQTKLGGEQALLLKMANVKYGDLKRSINLLVNDSERFVGSSQPKGPQ